MQKFKDFFYDDLSVTRGNYFECNMFKD
ncbi:hypothetical protein Q0P08_15145, partial [Staphylococcus aureus]|nr:hypothetical protein [Staphylococcus aureus]